MTHSTGTASEVTTTTPRVLTLNEIAQRLDMKKSNVAKFLARRGIEPAFDKGQGYFWWEADIERVKAEREADAERLAADQRRREAALRNHHGTDEDPALRDTPPAARLRLGATQRRVLELLSQRPVHADNDAERLALRRLRERGLVEPTAERGFYRLTASGREVVGSL